MGVFATRSPHRPNPIGLSLVKIERVEKDGIVLSGVDLVDGTPVLDIKPYLPEIENRPDAIGGWTQQVPQSNFQIKWSEGFSRQVDEWALRIEQPLLKQLIEETLRLDPRPLVYRGYEGGDSPYRQIHAVRLFDGDIHFRFISEMEIEIQDIRFQNSAM